MEEYLNKGIKEIIGEFPRIADILNEYNIGCVPCNIGTCLLKDIVGIHNLTYEEEQELMTRIARIAYPDRKVNIPKIRRKSKTKSKEIKYSPPVRKLVDEHLLIKRWIALIPRLIEELDIYSEEDRRLVIDGVDFIRSYADKYHHAKEEEILFKYFDENLDVLKTMYEEHQQGREHVKAVVEAIDKLDRDGIVKHLNAYKELLTEHIKKEDEILYPWMDRSLSISQIGELFSRFNETDEKFGNAPLKYGEFINQLEEKIKEVVK